MSMKELIFKTQLRFCEWDGEQLQTDQDFFLKKCYFLTKVVGSVMMTRLTAIQCITDLVYYWLVSEKHRYLK